MQNGDNVCESVKDTMIVLAIGDVVGAPGCDFLRRVLPAFKKQNRVDFCIVNGENSAQGNGILPQSAEHIFTSGADLITTGNHALRRREIYSVLDSEAAVIRPANFYRTAPGTGVYVLEKMGLRLAVINLQGSITMDYVSNPFDCADEIINDLRGRGINNILMDFHAEATSEKRAMGFWLDGKISALVGTHTHVQTADEQLLPKGTAYITDLGMTGVINSVLGIDIDLATERIRTALPVKFEQCTGECRCDGCLIEIEGKTGRAVSIERFSLT